MYSIKDFNTFSHFFFQKYTSLSDIKWNARVAGNGKLLQSKKEKKKIMNQFFARDKLFKKIMFFTKLEYEALANPSFKLG